MKTIEELAREAGFELTETCEDEHDCWWEGRFAAFSRFAALVRAEALEEAALFILNQYERQFANYWRDDVARELRKLKDAK